MYKTGTILTFCAVCAIIKKIWHNYERVVIYVSFSTNTSALSAKELYYWRIDVWLTTVGDYNQVRGVFDKLDCWMPPAVQSVFQKYYYSNPRLVKEKYYELDARIHRQWEAIMESVKELGLACTEADVREFRSLARSTLPENKFRTKVRGKVKRLFDNAVKARGNEEASKEAPMTLRELITWYQTPRKSSKKK